MEINTSNQVRGVETAPKVSKVHRETEGASGHQADQTEELSDYRISLSDASKKTISERKGVQASAQGTQKADLSEQAAAHVAQQVSEQLAQTNASLSNQAIQKAVDLFT